MAQLGQELAELVYRGQAGEAQLRASPLFPTLQQILQRTSDDAMTDDGR
jgi:hypothetical protein